MNHLAASSSSVHRWELCNARDECSFSLPLNPRRFTYGTEKPSISFPLSHCVSFGNNVGRTLYYSSPFPVLVLWRLLARGELLGRFHPTKVFTYKNTRVIDSENHETRWCQNDQAQTHEGVNSGHHQADAAQHSLPIKSPKHSHIHNLLHPVTC